MLEKNQELVATVVGLGTNGEGVIKAEGVTLFAFGCIPKEKVRIKILSIKKNVGYAKVLEVLTPADERLRPLCPVFGKCGGCQLQHLRYANQLRFKAGLVKDTLLKIGGIDVDVPTAVKSDDVYGYRNKLQIPVGKDRFGNNAIGFFAERSHRIVPVSECAIHPDWAKTLIETVYRFMGKCGLDGYDEATRSGEIRHLAVRQTGNSFLITVVTTVEKINGIDYLVQLLSEKFRTFSLWLNINTKDTNVVFGDRWQLVYGPESYESKECGVYYSVKPQTFVQINGGVRKKLYDYVVKQIESEDTNVYDCYSGGGMLTAMLAQRSKSVYGIEIVPEATACADELKLRNNLSDKMTNICGAVEDVLPKLLKSVSGKNMIVLDPPRKGVERSVIRAVIESGAEKVVMVSCNPATCARDVGLLTGSLVEENGELKKSAPIGDYEIEAVQPFDMFPQTKWVETVVILRKKRS